MTPEDITLLIENLPAILKLIQEIAKQTPQEIKATVEAFKTIKEALK